MKILFLTSTGLPKEIRGSFLKVLPKEPKDLKVAFIPTAAELDADKWYVDIARNELLEIGFPVEDVDLKIDPKVLKQKLEKSDVIYINGGNTFYLLEQVKKSGLDKYLEELINNGKIYIGSSAGSVLVGPNIEAAGWDPGWDKNVNNLEDSNGLNIVPFLVAPHFTEEEREVLERNKPNVNYEIIPITDKQAVLIEGEKYNIVGEGERVTLK